MCVISAYATEELAIEAAHRLIAERAGSDLRNEPPSLVRDSGGDLIVDGRHPKDNSALFHITRLPFFGPASSG